MALEWQRRCFPLEAPRATEENGGKCARRRKGRKETFLERSKEGKEEIGIGIRQDWMDAGVGRFQEVRRKENTV